MRCFLIKRYAVCYLIVSTFFFIILCPVYSLLISIALSQLNEEEASLFDVLWLLLASVIFVPIFQKLPGGEWFYLCWLYNFNLDPPSYPVNQCEGFMHLYWDRVGFFRSPMFCFVEENVLQPLWTCNLHLGNWFNFAFPSWAIIFPFIFFFNRKHQNLYWKWMEKMISRGKEST